MTSIREFAPAKINLTLDIAGWREDGFHELSSLVAFADVGDVVALAVDGVDAAIATGASTTPSASAAGITNERMVVMG